MVFVTKGSFSKKIIDDNAHKTATQQQERSCTIGLVVKSNVAIVGPRVRFPDGAHFSPIVHIVLFTDIGLLLHTVMTRMSKCRRIYNVTLLQWYRQIMLMFFVTRSFLPKTANPCRWRSFVAEAGTSSQPTYKTLQVQVIHRHGDRTPITPMKDVEYWQAQLVPPHQLERIALGTAIVRDKGKTFSHNAGGKGAFGKLTQLGLLQMVEVGVRLREQLSQGDGPFHSPLFNDERPLLGSSVRVFCTDFPRTIQSVQGLLVGLFDNIGADGDQQNLQSNRQTDLIQIDVRHTLTMIPDPQPRHTTEQERLEALVMSSSYVMEKEAANLDLARRVTGALHPLLGTGAHEVIFGVDEQHPEKMSVETEPLGWNQLAEITKCLLVRNLLPPKISKEDVEIIGQHTAWRWIETFSHPRLVFLAMNKLVSQQVKYMLDFTNQPCLTLWSAHDSTLLGLLSAYRLEQPSAWPAYASTLVIELVEETKRLDDGSETSELVVCFSLNGQRLRTMWDRERPLEAIPLSLLHEKIREEGSKT